MKKLISLGIVWSLLAGCGASRDALLLELRLKMPAQLAYQSGRYRRFLERASHLEILLDPPGAVPTSYTFPVQGWEKGLELSEMPGAPFELRVKIWDRKRDGTLRSEPALKGSAAVKAGQTEVVNVTLKLELSPAEYD